jgi:hypothetical protein
VPSVSIGFWVGHLEGLQADRHLPLLHDLQQGALHLGRRPVDLVGEQQVGEHRAERGVEIPRLLVVDARADQVGGHQVWGELDALELAADGLRQRLDRHRLRQPRHALHQDVPPRQQRDDQPLQQVVLPDDDLLHFVEHPLHRQAALRFSIPLHSASQAVPDRWGCKAPAYSVRYCVLRSAPCLAYMPIRSWSERSP